MASGLEDMGNASTAGRKETASEKEADKNSQTLIHEKRIADAISENCGAISVLFETTSGFAIFGYHAAKLTEPGAWKHIWEDFVNVPKATIWLRVHRTFENKVNAINGTTLSRDLSLMIREHVVNGQALAVGNKNYKNAIETSLRIPCLYGPAVEELMWGLKIQIGSYVPNETSELTNVDCFPMCKGIELFLNSRKLDVSLDMKVTKSIIEMAGIINDCDHCVDKHEDSLRLAAKYLMEISQIDTKDWDLLKLVTALKMICYPEDTDSAAQQLFPELIDKLMNDAPRYEDKIFKIPCLELYKEIYSARKIRLDAAMVLVRSVKKAKKAYEDEKRAKKEYEHEQKRSRGSNWQY